MTPTPDEQTPAMPPDEAAPAAPASDAAADAADAAALADSPDLSLAGEAMNLLSEHKGKLAIGVAATLGMMVYYGWREKRLAKTEPEEYARLQRLKAIVRHSDTPPKPRTRAAKKTTPSAPVEAETATQSGSEVPPGQDPAPELR